MKRDTFSSAVREVQSKQWNLYNGIAHSIQGLQSFLQGPILIPWWLNSCPLKIYWYVIITLVNFLQINCLTGLPWSELNLNGFSFILSSFWTSLTYTSQNITSFIKTCDVLQQSIGYVSNLSTFSTSWHT